MRLVQVGLKLWSAVSDGSLLQFRKTLDEDENNILLKNFPITKGEKFCSGVLCVNANAEVFVCDFCTGELSYLAYI